ncbi:MAG: hypothetical protein HY330_03790 [Chloroflexi bacterium]|nr:hypothetical protein [Chloroflexota bacterium]
MPTKGSPVQATVDVVQKIIHLAGSPHPFLSVYLPTDPAQATTEGNRLRLAALLDRASQDLADPSWEEPFRVERRTVEAYMRTLRPGGKGLAILSSAPAGEWQALWLPDAVPEHVRFGPGAHVLPLLDMLDEWEPVGLALVSKDTARLMVLEAGQIQEVRRVESEVPGKHKAGGYAGWEGARIQRHLLVHAKDHLKRALEELEGAHQAHPFRRLFLGGSPESVGLFKKLLSRELKSRLVGDLSIDLYATNPEVRAQVLQAARETERREEQGLVGEIITRAAKEQGAVVGVDPTLWALNRRQLHLLVLAGEVSQPGRHCAACDLLLSEEAVSCPQCGGKARAVDLWEELPRSALSRAVRIEVVHGEAASQLWHHDGLGGLLKPKQG